MSGRSAHQPCPRTGARRGPLCPSAPPPHHAPCLEFPPSLAAPPSLVPALSASVRGERSAHLQGSLQLRAGSEPQGITVRGGILPPHPCPSPSFGPLLAAPAPPSPSPWICPGSPHFPTWARGHREALHTFTKPQCARAHTRTPGQGTHTSWPALSPLLSPRGCGQPPPSAPEQ